MAMRRRFTAGQKSRRKKATRVFRPCARSDALALRPRLDKVAVRPSRNLRWQIDIAYTLKKVMTQGGTLFSATTIRQVPAFSTL